MTQAGPPARPGGMLDLIRDLYPLCRSITGEGVRRTLGILGEVIPLEVHEVPSGTPVLDWTVPDEWNIAGAWIDTVDGRRLVDFADTNLHVMGYSIPVRGRMPLEDLRPHLHTIPDHPDLVPYRTSFYEPEWGFCLSENQAQALTDPEYEVCIDSRLEPGHLTYAESYLAGDSGDEVLIFTHTCHPSLCNDNLSGMVVSAFLAAWLAERPRRYSYRFVYAPATIGSITWLARNPDAAARVRHGLTLTNLGDDRSFTYKKTEGGNAEIDMAVTHVLRHLDPDAQVVDFFPYGYDERQFNSPGFRLPVGSLMRARFGEYPEYHSSGDNLDFVSEQHLEGALTALQGVVEVLEGNRWYRSRAPYGEPQLGRRGIYRAVHGTGKLADSQFAMLWVLNQSDGEHSLLDIAARSGLPFATIRAVATILEDHDLIEEYRPRGGEDLR